MTYFRKTRWLYSRFSEKWEYFLLRPWSFDAVPTFYAIDLVNAKNLSSSVKKLEKYIENYLSLENLFTDSNRD